MAIKVKHDMNAAPAAAAGAASGRARRSMETARLFASGGGGGGRGGGQGATAHPVAPPTAHAQLLSAHAPTPVNWQLQRRENAAQEEARVKLAGVNNDAAMERERASIEAARERTQMGIDADAAKLKQQQEFTKSQSEAEREFRTKLAEEEAQRKQKEWDRQHNIMRQERDADLIAAGTHEYGYSPEVQREYDKIMNEYNAGLNDGRYKEGTPEAEQFKAQRDEKIAALPKTLVQRKDPEGLFRNATFTDAQGRIFTTDGKLIYNPADAETRRMEFDIRRQDAEAKRYEDAVMRLQQGYRTAEPVYKMDDMGEKPLVGADGNPIVEKWNSVYKHYTPEQQDAILRQLFPSRFADLPQPSAPTAQPVPASAAKRTAQPDRAVDWKELWK